MPGNLLMQEPIKKPWLAVTLGPGSSTVGPEKAASQEGKARNKEKEENGGVEGEASFSGKEEEMINGETKTGVALGGGARNPAACKV
ncbi:hypothetical protein NDU88_001828 [Pleurodeles waltl]|uniref:Uncharacterized protein n=1 Tax=Pleurodeles waltl TaxID=8319 RepID=A0AAV7VBI2_PLEWA|nr:hypothetical protein NDU88_001828 [Pleurodeles waltl]